MSKRKKCSKCGEKKSLDDFYKNKGLKDGLENTCKMCSSENRRNRRKQLAKRDIKDVPFPMTKKCCTCKKIKNKDEFGIDLGIFSGLSSSCKECERCKNKKYREKIKKNIQLVIVSVDSKMCSKCGKNKSKDNFYKCRYNKSGLESRCITCRDEYMKEYRGRMRNRKLVDIPEYKKCSRCKKIKQASAFVRDISNKDGLASRCQDCNRPNIIAANERRRAIKKSINEKFTADDRFLVMSIQKECAKCGSTDNLCIDHLNPLSKGNPLSVLNATVLCRSCNSKKSSKDPKDFFSEEEYSDILVAISVAHIIKYGVY